MLGKTRNATADSPAGGVTPGTATRPPGNTAVTRSPGNGAPVPADSGPVPAPPAATSASETRRDRFRRKAHRSRLHGYAILTVALVAFLIALAASNTAHVKVNWVFGSSRVSLVWLVLFAAILGWLLGLVATARFHWLTRAPRGAKGTR
jgi:uncharacterized integral membrane protein